MTKPYAVVITKPDHSPAERRFGTQSEALAAYCRSVLALRRFDAIITVTYRPPVEKGMFGITMPVETIASCEISRKKNV